MSPLTAVSLFDGIHGIGLALRQAGINVVAGVEIDPAASGVTAHHYPDMAMFGDVTEVTGDDLRAAGFVPERGLLAAGWPCQGNSVAGRRGGMGDPRSGLWGHVVRLLSETRPAWFLGENVPGLLSVNGGADMHGVLHDLDGLGYGVAWRILDAAGFGVPQRRRRVIFVGRLGDGAAPVQVLLEPEGRAGHPAPRRPARAGVAGTLGSRAGGSRSTDLDGHGAYVPLEVVSTVQGGGRRGYRLDAEAAAGGHLVPWDGDMALTANGVGASGADDNQAQAGHLIGFDLAQITSGANRSNPQPGDPQPPLAATGNPHVAYALTAHHGRNADNADNADNWITHALTSEGADASEDGTGRGTPLVPMSLAVAGDFSVGIDVAQTVRSANGQPGCVATGPTTAVRRLTPTECEALQGLPRNWTAISNGKPQSDSARYRQIGNSVAVPCLAWVARRIAAVDAGGPP